MQTKVLNRTRVALHHCPGLSYRQLHYWCTSGAITPARGPAGSGAPLGFSDRDIRKLQAITEVYKVLVPAVCHELDHSFIRRMWDDLDTAEGFRFQAGPVSIEATLPLAA